MSNPAWCALGPSAQALYPWLKFEWKGKQYNNNGAIALSVSQAADRMGIGKDAAASAFRDLQAKGFIVVTKPGVLGVAGQARCPTYELTELPLPGTKEVLGKRLFDKWEPGKDFNVVHHNANNPSGRNGSKTPSRKPGRSCPEFADETVISAPSALEDCPENPDVRADSEAQSVPNSGTSLITIPVDFQIPDLSRGAGLWLCPLL